MNMHDTATVDRLQHECLKLKAERDELREELIRLGDSTDEELCRVMNERDELRAQLEVVREAWPHIKHTIMAGATNPVWPMVRLMESALLQPDSGKLKNTPENFNSLELVKENLDSGKKETRHEGNS